MFYYYSSSDIALRVFQANCFVRRAQKKDLSFWYRNWLHYDFEAEARLEPRDLSQFYLENEDIFNHRPLVMFAADSKPVFVIAPCAVFTPAHYGYVSNLLVQAGYGVVCSMLPRSGTVNSAKVNLENDMTYVRDSLVLPLLDDEERNVIVIGHSYSGIPVGAAIDVMCIVQPRARRHRCLGRSISQASFQKVAMRLRWWQLLVDSCHRMSAPINVQHTSIRSTLTKGDSQEWFSLVRCRSSSAAASRRALSTRSRRSSVESLPKLDFFQQSCPARKLGLSGVQWPHCIHQDARERSRSSPSARDVARDYGIGMDC